MSRIFNDEYRIKRLREHGYNPIHLFGRWYLGREWSKNCRKWYAKLPIYRPFYLRRKMPVICTDEAVEIDAAKLRV